MRRILLRLAAVAGMLAAGLPGVAGAQGLASAHRPAAVPANYLVTPFGYFHPSCIKRLASGDELRPAQRTVRHADGTSTNMQGCAYAHYRADGERVVGDERGVTNPDISHAYVEDATVTTTKSYGYLSGQWTVPPAPATDHGQTIYLFPGMIDGDDIVTIIQPVLGWNSDYASAWGIASWNCCEDGTVYEAAPQPVSSGDTIRGTMYNGCPPGTESCSSWDIVTEDLRTGGRSELLDTSNFGQVFNVAFAAALEVYGIQSCDDYPAVNGEPGSDGVSFNTLSLYDDKLKEVKNPNWQFGLYSSTGLTPQCSYTSTKPQQVILHY